MTEFWRRKLVAVPTSESERERERERESVRERESEQARENAILIAIDHINTSRPVNLPTEAFMSEWLMHFIKLWKVKTNIHMTSQDAEFCFV